MEEIELKLWETLNDLLPSSETKKCKEYAKHCSPLVLEVVRKRLQELLK